MISLADTEREDIDVEGHLLRFLFEKKGFSALVVDASLTILKIEIRQRIPVNNLRLFLHRPLFELLPELAPYEKELSHLFFTPDRLTFDSLCCSSLDPSCRYDITALPYQESAQSSQNLLLLFEPDTTPEKKLQQQLVAERKAAQISRRVAAQARRASTNFLANISHEIRTPMNGVIGMTNLLLATPQTAEQREYTDIIRTSGEALLAVINDILDYSKIESNHVSIDNEPFKLRHCIEECLDIFAARAAQKNIELVYSLVHPCPETIICDKAKLKQILNNLIGNAVKFTDAGDVVVSVKYHMCPSGQSKLSVEIQDTGIGIPKYAQKNIFKAFEQVQSSQIGHQGGTGLGLAITKRLVELLGGSLSVKSKLGSGSTFFFDILIDCPKKMATEELNRADNLFAEKRVLVVDDNATNRRILTDLLRSWGVQTVEAQDGAVALLQLAKEIPFDLAILDKQMPGLDGLELAKEIRQMSRYQELPLVLLTSVGWPQDKSLLKKYKITHYLTKPVKQSQLYDILVALLTQADVDDESFSISHDLQLDAKMGQKWPLHILVAEDNAVNQRFIEQILRKLGYHPDIVASGSLALEHITRKMYDLVLMDIQMPNMDGLEAAQKIAELLPVEGRPTIIALTAHAMPGDRDKFLRAGMDGYLGKPLKFGELLSALKNCLPIAARQKVTAKRFETSNEAECFDDTIFDIHSIKQLTGFEATEDDVIFKEILETYLDETNELWHDILSASQHGDFVRLHRAAHTIKSSSQTIGAKQFAELAARLAEAADRKDDTITREIIQHMDEEKDRLFSSLTVLCTAPDN